MFDHRVVTLKEEHDPLEGHLENMEVRNLNYFSKIYFDHRNISNQSIKNYWMKLIQIKV